jgi:hypothetical protein
MTLYYRGDNIDDDMCYDIINDVIEIKNNKILAINNEKFIIIDSIKKIDLTFSPAEDRHVMRSIMAKYPAYWILQIDDVVITNYDKGYLEKIKNKLIEIIIKKDV